MRKKVAIIVVAGSVGTTNYGQNTYAQHRVINSTLDQLGYEYDTFCIEKSSTLGQVAGFENLYESIIIPYSSPDKFAYTDNFAKLLSGYARVPVFALGIVAGGSGTPSWQRTCGVDTTGATSTGYLRYTIGGKNLHWSGRTLVADATYGADVVPIANLYGSTTQFWLWKKTGSVSTCYYEATTAVDRPGLLFLLGQALIDGNISAPPKPILATLDIDDFPTTSGYPLNTVNDLQTTYAILQSYGAKTVWGIQASAILWDDPAVVTPAQKAFLASVDSDLVSIVEHDIPWGAGTAKATLDTNYRATITRMAEDGVVVDVAQNGYRYFPSNSFTDTAMQLASSETDSLSSPDDAALQAGYGWRVVRTDTPYSATNPFGENYTEMGVRDHRSIRIISSALVAPPSQYSCDRTTNADVWSKAFYYTFIDAWSYGAVPYLHGSNFYSGGTTGDGWGNDFLTDVCELVEFLGPFAQWAFPSELATNVVMRQG